MQEYFMVNLRINRKNIFSSNKKIEPNRFPHLHSKDLLHKEPRVPQIEIKNNKSDQFFVFVVKFIVIFLQNTYKTWKIELRIRGFFNLLVQIIFRQTIDGNSDF